MVPYVYARARLIEGAQTLRLCLVLLLIDGAQGNSAVQENQRRVTLA